VGFVLFLLVLAMLASVQDFSLVESDYYRKGLHHQDHIDAARRAAALSTDLSVAIDIPRSELVVSFPPECAGDTVESDVLLYRPSNAAWDRNYGARRTADGVQRLPVARLIPGLWRLRVQWRWRGASYYSETKVFFPS
jgi:hypothetical protein